MSSDAAARPLWLKHYSLLITPKKTARLTCHFVFEPIRVRPYGGLRVWGLGFGFRV